MSIIVYDTETTGLLSAMASSVEHQPFLVEFSGIKLDLNYDIVQELNFRCRPPIVMNAEVIRIHGITNADIENCKPFSYWLPIVTQFFVGSEVSVGHNIEFDKMILYWELFRLGKQTNFPWSPRDICTVELSNQLWGKRLNLADLHTKLFGVGFSGAHSASVDCEITRKCFIELSRLNLIDVSPGAGAVLLT